MRQVEKVSVSIQIPALGGTYEFIIPNNMSIRHVQQLIIRILASEYGILGNFEDLVLFDKSDALALNLDCSFMQLGIYDGAVLVFM